MQRGWVVGVSRADIVLAGWTGTVAKRKFSLAGLTSVSSNFRNPVKRFNVTKQKQKHLKVSKQTRQKPKILRRLLGHNFRSLTWQILSLQGVVALVHFKTLFSRYSHKWSRLASRNYPRIGNDSLGLAVFLSQQIFFQSRNFAYISEKPIIPIKTKSTQTSEYDLGRAFFLQSTREVLLAAGDSCKVLLHTSADLTECKC